ncbi:MAG: biotin--[acetyl-CoA-carboxylase] ligase [Dehalococcoidia bacterium]|nr:biotin--[acetyl-CoA-carboxylase] ligase [Dehalococcoidia bacterium]
MTGKQKFVNLAISKVNEMKGEILKALRGSGGYVSGELLAQELCISRVSVWKHIHDLKQDGYILEASAKGYHLISSPDLLLPCEFPSWEEKIHYFREIGSTMDVAKDLAKKGAEEGTIIVAEHQTGGRGRLKREWLSPRGGIYFTLILRPKISPVYAPRINLMASVAVAKTIRKLFGLKAELKWPNDVLIEGKKVCGILAEMDAETDVINFVNLGMGINANTPITQLGEMATSLKDALGKEISRMELLSSMLTEIAKQQAVLTQEDLLEEWKSLSATLNKNVKVVTPGEEMIGQAVGIDTSGALMIRSKEGSLRTVIAGDCIHLMKQS